MLVQVLSSTYGEPSTEKIFAVYLVDWESAGWYPSYGEYVSSFFAFKWDDDWMDRVEGIVDAWDAEAAMMRVIYQDIWW
jgi:hypothetical protein